MKLKKKIGKDDFSFTKGFDIFFSLFINPFINNLI